MGLCERHFRERVEELADSEELAAVHDIIREARTSTLGEAITGPARLSSPGVHRGTRCCGNGGRVRTQDDWPHPARR
ncbi:hypothetical protein C8039_18140 [Halogeometricum sp. wsp3]|nr:hypothetical protein C8039_18140 [Halogeometricum sp. wsp3]